MGCPPVRSHRDLHIWQAATQLACVVYRVVESFPRSENSAIVAQLRRSAVSVASNIAEGSARGSTREFLRFLLIARGSLAELQTQLFLSHRVGYLTDEAFHDVDREIDRLGRRINATAAGLRQRLSKDSD